MNNSCLQNVTSSDLWSKNLIIRQTWNNNNNISNWIWIDAGLVLRWKIVTTIDGYMIYMWESCRIFISYDVGFTFVTVGWMWDLQKKLILCFLVQNLWYVKNCGGGGEWGGDGIAAVQLFPFFYLQTCNPKWNLKDVGKSQIVITLSHISHKIRDFFFQEARMGVWTFSILQPTFSWLQGCFVQWSKHW